MDGASGASRTEGVVEHSPTSDESNSSGVSNFSVLCRNDLKHKAIKFVSFSA